MKDNSINKDKIPLYKSDILRSFYTNGVGGVLSDEQIQELGIVDPCILESPPGVISYGLTSYGYDMRLARNFKVFTDVHGAIVDPKNLNHAAFVDIEADYCLIPPRSFILGQSIEKFNIPRDVIGIAVGKSTYARCGISICITPLESEWIGNLTIEISNNSPCPAKVYANEGIAQIIFIKSIRSCFTSYLDKKGVYQNQQGLELAKIRGEDNV